jgi:hypothetical protein
MKNIMVLLILPYTLSAQNPVLDPYGGVSNTVCPIPGNSTVYATLEANITGNGRAQSFTLSNVSDSAISGGSILSGVHLAIDVGNNRPIQVSKEQIATGNGSATKFTGYLAHSTVLPNSLRLTAGNVSGTEANGAIAGTGIAYGAVSPLLDSTQDWFDIQFATAPEDGVPVYVSYKYLPAEVVKLEGARVGKTVIGVVRNNHDRGAVVLYGGFMLGKLHGNHWVLCDALHNA